MTLSYKEPETLLRLLRWPAGNKELFLEALTHSSYAYETEGLCSNERLEFLGDAALELIISEYLFNSFPHEPEGKLTLMRHNIVNEKSLAQIARSINLGTYIRLGKGEHLSGGSEKISVLADALEALIGALFLDRGYRESAPLIIALFNPLLKTLEKGKASLLDFKTMLQEIYQSRGARHPIYEITAEYGPPHEKTFEAVVRLENKIMGAGVGKTKKEAEQSAAKAALEFMGL